MSIVCLLFAYTDARGQSSERRVEPYQVVFKESSWYLQAYCLDKKRTTGSSSWPE
ncbi:WYL domain-containing protein [Paenibacillus rhizoplanae]